MIKCRKCGKQTDFLVDGNETYCEECVYKIEEEVNLRAFKHAQTSKADNNAKLFSSGSFTLPKL